MGISVEFTGTLLYCSSIHCFQIELEFTSAGFCGGRKTGVPGKKPSEQGREPTTNSTHILRLVGIPTQVALVGSERSRHCAILRLLQLVSKNCTV